MSRPASARRTAQAIAYVATTRHDDSPIWEDVATAYDAGLRSAVENRQNARRQLKDVEPVAEACA